METILETYSNDNLDTLDPVTSAVVVSTRSSSSDFEYFSEASFQHIGKPLSVTTRFHPKDTHIISPTASLDKVAQAFATSTTTQWKSSTTQRKPVSTSALSPSKVANATNGSAPAYVSRIMVESAAPESAYIGVVHCAPGHKLQLIQNNSKPSSVGCGDVTVLNEPTTQQASTSGQFSLLLNARSSGKSLPFRNSLYGFKRPETPSCGQGTASKTNSLALSSLKLGEGNDAVHDYSAPKRRVSFSQSDPEIHFVDDKNSYKRAGNWPEYSHEEKRRFQIEMDTLNAELVGPTFRPIFERTSRSSSVGSSSVENSGDTSFTTHTELLRRVSDGYIDIYKPHREYDEANDVHNKIEHSQRSIWSRFSPKRLFHRKSSWTCK